MFDDDYGARQRNIEFLNSRTPKGFTNLSVGQKVVASHNFSTGDRSYCTHVLEVLSINEEGTHAQFLYNPGWGEKEPRKSILFLREYEFYTAPVIVEEPSVVEEPAKEEAAA